MSLLIRILRDVPDPRTGNARRHDLLNVLVIALRASICGCESCVEFADFAEDRADLFREFLSLENGLPSHDTFLVCSGFSIRKRCRTATVVSSTRSAWTATG